MSSFLYKSQRLKYQWNLEGRGVWIGMVGGKFWAENLILGSRESGVGSRESGVALHRYSFCPNIHNLCTSSEVHKIFPLLPIAYCLLPAPCSLLPTPLLVKGIDQDFWTAASNRLFWISEKSSS